ncbi:MAG: PPC domain-containing protein [Gemmataceae bacterium]
MRPLALLLFAPLMLALGQENKKPPAKNPPSILMALPFGVEPGKKTTVVLRGLGLDSVKTLRFTPAVEHRILRKGSVGVPNQQEASVVGSSEVEVELTVPATLPGESFEVIATSPEGESKPRRILLDRTPLVAEKEPNNGFKLAQRVAVGQVIEGIIDPAQDVDVFTFPGTAGERLVVEVMAARHGSGLDAFLVLHDGDGQVVAMSDDEGGSADPRLEVTLKRNGNYFVSVSDAHDQGGRAHRYRLHLSRAVKK